MTDTNAIRAKLISTLKAAGGIHNPDANAPHIADAILALLATDRAAGVGEEGSVIGDDPDHQYAVVSANYARPFLVGAYPTLARAMIAQDGKSDLWHVYRRVDAAPSPPAPADASGEVLRSAIMAEVVEGGRWSLRFDFGKGDAACLSMREAADTIRKLIGAK